MTDEELAAIRERAERASSGPWKGWDAWDIRPGMVAMPRLGPVQPECGFFAGGADIVATVADAEFVLHARTDVPLLLIEVARLREVVGAVAQEEGIVSRADDGDGICGYCGVPRPYNAHGPDCLVTRARAALGKGERNG